MTDRLSVNINNECAETLRRVKANRGIDTTEAIRRAISLLDYYEKKTEMSRLHGGEVEIPTEQRDDRDGHNEALR